MDNATWCKSDSRAKMKLVNFLMRRIGSHKIARNKRLMDRVAIWSDRKLKKKKERRRKARKEGKKNEI